MSSTLESGSVPAVARPLKRVLLIGVAVLVACWGAAMMVPEPWVSALGFTVMMLLLGMFTAVLVWVLRLDRGGPPAP